MNMTEKTAFGVVYFCKDNCRHSASLVLADDYWEACGAAWSALPEGAADFQIVEDMTAAAFVLGHSASLMQEAA